jgi:hypothetical protein
MKRISKNIDDLVVDVIKKYNEKSINVYDNHLKSILELKIKELYNHCDKDFEKKLVEYIIVLTINDLDIGSSYYTKTTGNPTVEEIIKSEVKLRQANESRSRNKNDIDQILLRIAGSVKTNNLWPIGKNTRVTNVDSFSAYIDRLITERIKEYHFKNTQNKPEEAIHQNKIVEIISEKIDSLIEEIYQQEGYEYISEKRTFDEIEIIQQVDNVLKDLK